MNKYNEFMGHIKVDDEMHRRIMMAVSDAINEDGTVKNVNPEDRFVIKADVEPLSSAASESKPVKRKAKVSGIQILSIAAVGILVAGGAVFFATRFMRGSNKSAEMMMATNAAETVGNAEVDSALNGNYDNAPKSASKKTLTGGKKTEEETTEATTLPPVEGNDGVGSVAPGESKENIAESEDGEDRNKAATYDLKPHFKFNVKTVGRSTLTKDISVTVYTGDNGEKALVFEAKEGTDIVKAYYPKFKGIPAQLKTAGGQSFTAIDTSVATNEMVSTTGPFDAVTWNKNGKTYMIAFSQKTDLDEFLSLMDKV